jgi:hypothetical protein
MNVVVQFGAGDERQPGVGGSVRRVDERFIEIELRVESRIGLSRRTAKCVRRLPPVTIKRSLSDQDADGR